MNDRCLVPRRGARHPSDAYFGAMSDRHIVAMGGGGFLHDGDSLLDDYALGLAGADPPRVCYLGTATGDAPAASPPSTGRSRPSGPGRPT